jgi:hypothetical protein
MLEVVNDRMAALRAFEELEVSVVVPASRDDGGAVEIVAGVKSYVTKHRLLNFGALASIRFDKSLDMRQARETPSAKQLRRYSIIEKA